MKDFTMPDDGKLTATPIGIVLDELLEAIHLRYPDLRDSNDPLYFMQGKYVGADRGFQAVLIDHDNRMIGRLRDNYSASAAQSPIFNLSGTMVNGKLDVDKSTDGIPGPDKTLSVVIWAKLNLVHASGFEWEGTQTNRIVTPVKATIVPYTLQPITRMLWRRHSDPARETIELLDGIHTLDAEAAQSTYTPRA